MRFFLIDRLESNAYFGFIRYDLKKEILSKERRNFIQSEINKCQIDKISDYDIDAYQAFIDFVDGKYDEVERILTQCYSRGGSGIKRLGVIREPNFNFIFLVRFKNGYKGFWDFALNLLRNTETEPIVIDLCETVRDYYNEEDFDERIEILTNSKSSRP